MLALTDGYELDPASLFHTVEEPVGTEATEFLQCTHPSVCSQCLLPLGIEWEVRWTPEETLIASAAAVRTALGAISRRIGDPSELAMKAASLLERVGCVKAETRVVIRTPCRCENQGQVYLATLGH